MSKNEKGYQVLALIPLSGILFTACLGSPHAPAGRQERSAATSQNPVTPATSDAKPAQQSETPIDPSNSKGPPESDASAVDALCGKAFDANLLTASKPMLKTLLQTYNYAGATTPKALAMSADGFGYPLVAPTTPP